MLLGTGGKEGRKEGRYLLAGVPLPDTFDTQMYFPLRVKKLFGTYKMCTGINGL